MRNRVRRLSCFALFWAVVATLVASPPAIAQESVGQIAFAGHGAFFDRTGTRIVPTAKVIGEAIAAYKADAYGRATAEVRASYERQLAAAVAARALTANQRMVLELRALDWLYRNIQQKPADVRSRGMLNGLIYVLQFELPASATAVNGSYAKPLPLPADFETWLQRYGFGSTGPRVMSATANSGAAYITECRNNGVPIPPPIGDSRWVSQGFIPADQLFLQNANVEVMTYRSTSPDGMCIALPRSNDPAGVTVALDGVVCLGKQPSPLSGKSTVCFWDNQMNGSSFSFTKGTRIPIGWNDPAQVSPNPGGRFMSGGAQLTSGGAGQCSDCHAGQNPFIVHPRNPSPARPFGQVQAASVESVLGKLSKPPLNLPMWGDTWYDPLVLSFWPQNQKRLNDAYVPGACQACHLSGGSGGQLPHLSNALPGYCSMILKNAIQVGIPHSMPQGNPGSAANDADVKAIADLTASMANPSPFCAISPTAGPADRGDPHILTTNGVAYDFQAAGEFVALRDTDADFELQTRQSPVLTTFVPGPDSYTGIASCVSLNTAVALRLNGQRVTYQQVGTPGQGSRMELRIRGRLTGIDNRIDLGGGAAIISNGEGSLTFVLADGTRVIATPRYWSSQGYWYIDVDVLNTSARAGIMGHILGGEWLPRGGDRSNYGRMPTSVTDRYNILYGKFADSWRVTDATSLFDYPPGLTPKSYVDANWPLASNGCRRSSVAAPTVREPLSYDAAKQACRELRDPAALMQCLFDTQVLGDIGVVKSYLRTLEVRAAVQATIK